MLLRVVAGLDVAQTATVLGKRDGAVRVAAMRGLKRLALILAEDEPAGGPARATARQPVPRTAKGADDE